MRSSRGYGATGAISRVVEEGDSGVRRGRCRDGRHGSEEDVAVVGEAVELDAPLPGVRPLLGRRLKMRSGCWGRAVVR